MFGSKHYVCILKGKEGEYGSLRNLDPVVKAGLTPLVEIIPVPWDFENEQPLKSLDDHLAPAADKIVKAWGTERPLFIDLCWIPGTATVADGRHALSFVFDDARVKRLKAIPVTGLDRDAAYQVAVKDTVARDRFGVCLRLDREDFDDLAALKGAVDALLKDIGVSPDATDLVVDFRDISPGQAATLALAAQAIIASLPYVNDWRSLTLAASAFPENLSGFQANAVSKTERTEWLLWQTLFNRAKAIPRMPSFGDYVIAHPDQPEDIDPRVMKMSANLRYTTDTAWLIFRGRNVKQFGFDQFNDLCRSLVAMPEYSGRGYSWGDTYIADCATNDDGPGNATTWRRVGTTHHITLVFQQIASLP